MKNRLYRAARLLPALAVIPLAGCISILEGTSQEITVATAPAEASCTLEREGKVFETIERTPKTVMVRKSKYDITVRCNKPGYQEATYLNHSGASATIAANVAMDLILTAGLSSIIDSANGADNKYETAVVITLMPTVAGTDAAITPASAVVAPTSK